MGTRSLTTFIERWNDETTGKKKQVKIVTMYRQMDGYPEGHGIDLADFLAGGTVVNGLPVGVITGEDKTLYFNGMGCLSAQVIGHFKTNSGGIYLHRGGTTNCWEQYKYEVIVDEDNPKEILLRCYDVYDRKWIFEGSPKDFVKKYKVKEKV